MSFIRSLICDYVCCVYAVLPTTKCFNCSVFDSIIADYLFSSREGATIVAVSLFPRPYDVASPATVTHTHLNSPLKSNSPRSWAATFTNYMTWSLCSTWQSTPMHWLKIQYANRFYLVVKKDDDQWEKTPLMLSLWRSNRPVHSVELLSMWWPH